MNDMQKRFLLTMYQKNREMLEGIQMTYISLPHHVISDFDVENDLPLLIERGFIRRREEDSDFVEITEEGKSYVEEFILEEE